MRNDWLAALSFERMHIVISAINTLSIHAKLLLAGVDNAAHQADVDGARSALTGFVERLDRVLQDIKASPDGPIVSADPRWGDLATQFLSAQQHVPQRSLLFTLPLAQLRALIGSEQPDDLRALIQALRDLRTLVEQHSHDDVVGILGEI